ncbi:MAG: hypothetical protein CUN52_11240 [Phototrophicales bacterium]|nr:MAG: hypothetical protein CUN52_11240 [Phototrophicales bacterium]
MRRLLLLLILFCFAPNLTQAEGSLTEICPDITLQNRWEGFAGDGIILTTFDGYWMWTYDVKRNVRYALEGIPACGSNCHLSRDGMWITYLRVMRGDFIRTGYGKMRLDGSLRTLLVENVAEVEWWSDTALLVWDRNYAQAYLQSENGWRFETLDVRGITRVQPSGYWGLHIRAEGDVFYRSLLNLRTRNRPPEGQVRVEIGENIRYFNAGAWSSDGRRYAFIMPMMQADEHLSSEVFLFNPNDRSISQITQLTDEYGAIRINGLNPSELSWSPNNQKIAFWVLPLGDDSPEAPTQTAILHILDVITHDITRYCGYRAETHTPNPPKLRWSPDGVYIALGGNPPNDNRGALLMALHTETGVFHVLSAGLASTFGNTDVIAWGIKP